MWCGQIRAETVRLTAVMRTDPREPTLRSKNVAGSETVLAVQFGQETELGQ